MMKKKRQDALLASSTSCRRENSPENLHSKTVGCMSGLFHHVFNYNNSRHRRHRKFLTSGKTPEKKMEDPLILSRKAEENGSRRRLLCDVDRSPMLGADMRQSKTVVVKSVSESAAAAAAKAEEKRKKLMEALGKCDEDLKALKKMIEVVKNNAHEQQLQPSPVSVLHPSPFASYSNAAVQCQKQKQKKKPGEDEMISNKSLVERIKADNVEPMQAAKPYWVSRAMVDSVNEVCRDISWGERREIGRIGVALQDFICRDLIEEFVRELGCNNCMYYYSLPFDACKRQLLFQV